MKCVQNARQLPVLTSAEKLVKSTELNTKFPVSSGVHHHRKEDEWVPVEKAQPQVYNVPYISQPTENVFSSSIISTPETVFATTQVSSKFSVHTL